MTALPQDDRHDDHWDAVDYLAWERGNPQTRHELINGQIVAITGASRAHNLIANNISSLFNFALRDRPCEVYASDMRVQVRAEGTYTYPDVVVICGEPAFADDEHIDTLLNPTLLVEVLSPSTELTDRGVKLAQYRLMPSLQDYLLVAQDQARIERYTRHTDGWLYTDTVGQESVVELASIDCTLALADVYRKVSFERDEQSD